MLSHINMFERIVTGSLLGAMIGYERHRHGRPAGLRTHLLVALAEQVEDKLVLEVNLPPTLPFPYVVHILQAQERVAHVSIRAA